MTFAKAFQKAFAEQGQTVDTPNTEMYPTNPEDIPMMYRAQISGRCSLQYAGSEDDRDRWMEEWLDPQPGETQPRRQHSTDVKKVLEEGHIYRVKISFPWRVFTNCGQDSIARPVLDVRGIPQIPGSSIKGLFRRACQKRDRDKPESERLTNRYCGDKDNLKPGILRFHGAYPVGDWAGTVETSDTQPNSPNYRMVDVVHPQQDWQMGTNPPKNGKKTPKKGNANALISLYKPTLVFEISSSEFLSQEQWTTIAAILRAALRPGLGGKTSSGYGLVYEPRDKYNFDIRLTGKGMTPVLLGKEPEFRPNLFKAALRGHTRRLLAGCTNRAREVDNRIGQLFGSTKAPSRVEIYWKEKSLSQLTTTYDVKGTLCMSAPDEKERNLLEAVLKFAYTMGGFGKSWRRVWHEMFYQPIYQQKHHKRYNKDIGCHWESNEYWLNEIETPEQLRGFLDNLEQVCRQYWGGSMSQPVDWRETWHRDRVAVYGAVTARSQAIELFHDAQFKTTPAIGGKQPGDKRPKHVSSVLHRMLPIAQSSSENAQYLEIVTVFHGKNSSWQKNWERDGESQLNSFIQELKKKGLALTWGN
ncbi:MAG: RAMP superfamily CRISPR-associated protein [Cyanobacteriota bacterium]|nr:RAMP superfamily CRISPR-associated protein [Cyanobacteriota bacterium]